MFEPSLGKLQVNAFSLFNVHRPGSNPVEALNFELSMCSRLMHLTLKCTKFSCGGACPRTPLEGQGST